MRATDRFFLAVTLSFGCASCVSASRVAEVQDDVVPIEALDACLAQFEVEVRDSLKSPPPFSTVVDAARWARTHLPSNLAAAFNAAGQASRGERASDASRRGNLHEQIYAATAKHLFAAASIQQKACHLVIPEKLSQVLYSSMRLDREPIRSQLAAVGLDDVYEVESSFMLMLTLDATGLPWDERMFTPNE
jgi:hypothetical protein